MPSAATVWVAIELLVSVGAAPSTAQATACTPDGFVSADASAVRVCGDGYHVLGSVPVSETAGRSVSIRIVRVTPAPLTGVQVIVLLPSLRSLSSSLPLLPCSVTVPVSPSPLHAM